MVRARNLNQLINLSTVFFACFTAHASEDKPQKAAFPINRFEFAQKINAKTSALGIRAFFQTSACQKLELPEYSSSYCDYGFLSLRYRFWIDNISGEITKITGSPSYTSRDYLNDRATLGLSLLISTIEENSDDNYIASIRDRLAGAGRLLSGASEVKTTRGIYRMRLDRDGYAFEVRPSAG